MVFYCSEGEEETVEILSSPVPGLDIRLVKLMPSSNREGCTAGLRIRIRIIHGSGIRIRIRVKSWIRIRNKVKIQKLLRLIIQPWRAVDAHNRGLETLNGALEGP
jgi:hypothetical protein